MATVNREKLLAVAKAFGTIAENELRENGEGKLFEYAMRFQGTSPELVLNRLFSFATMKKWVGERKVSDRLIKDYTLTSDKYESTILVDRDDVVWDRLGLYEFEIRNMMDAYRRKRRRMVTNILLNNDVGIDGKALFATDHPLADGSTYSNYLGDSKALDATNYAAARLQMETLTDHQGEPLDISPDTLIIGPHNRAAARELFGKEYLSGGESNIYYGEEINVVVEPMFGDSEAWFLLDSRKPLKPVIVMDVPRPSGQIVEFAAVTNPDDSFVFDNDAYKYGISARWGMAPGVPQVILGANLSSS